MATGRIPSVQNASTLAGATLATNVTASSLTSFGTSPALTTPTISTATTNGDILYGTGSGAISRLGIGSSAQVLTVASGIPSWATPASGSTFVGARVTNVAQQTIANSTNTLLTYTVETYDTDGFHDNTTNTSRFTIPAGKAGKYLINFIALWSSPDNTGVRNVSLFKNGSDILLKTFGLSTRSDLGMSLTSVQSAIATDYFEISVYQSSGGNLDINKGSAYAEFSISYLGA